MTIGKLVLKGRAFRILKWCLRRLIKGARNTWEFIKNHANVIQALAAVIGIITIVYSLQTLKLELKKFNLDYGPQAQLIYSGSVLVADTNNVYVTDPRVTTDVYLELSEDDYEKKNAVYIKINNFYECIGPYSEPDAECRERNYIQRPILKPIDLYYQFQQLRMIFNLTPTKVYPHLLCTSVFEFTDPKRTLQREYYVSPGCGDGWFSSHYKVSSEEFKLIPNEDEIIGELDYALTGPLGFGDFAFTRSLLAILSKEKWGQRFIEPSSHRWYRSVYTIGSGDPQRWKEFMQKYQD